MNVIALRHFLRGIVTVVIFPYLFVKDWVHYSVAVARWGRCRKFFRIDLHCLLLYMFDAPYRLCKRGLKRYDQDQVQRAYGETFFTSLDLMMQRVNICSTDIVYELGCGRGRAAFFIHLVYGCQVVGIDLTPEFIDRANKLVLCHGLTGIRFEQENLMDCSLLGATVVYIYATEFAPEALINLLNVLRRAPVGARVICVSRALHLLAGASFLQPMDAFKVSFIWGRAPVFTYRILDSFQRLL